MELTLSPTEIEELRKLQRNLQGRLDYARVTCILMLSMGNTPIFVADCLGIDISTIYRYRSLYLEGGLDKLLENRYRGYQGLLNIFQIESLKQELRTHLYTDAKQVSQWVKDTFEVTYTPQGMADLLNRIGFSYKLIKGVRVTSNSQFSFDKFANHFFLTIFYWQIKIVRSKAAPEPNNYRPEQL